MYIIFSRCYVHTFLVDHIPLYTCLLYHIECHTLYTYYSFFLHRVKASELVSGKKVCEKVFQHAIAKITIPARTREQQQRVVGELG